MWITDGWWHHDGTRCDTFTAQTREPICGGDWWCLDHDQWITYEEPTSG